MAVTPSSSFQGPLAPKHGLSDSFHSPIQNQDLQKNSDNKGGGKRTVGKYIPFAALGLALLVLPLTLEQLNQQQDVRQQASQPTPTITLPTPIPSPTPTITPALEPETTPLTIQ